MRPRKPHIVVVTPNFPIPEEPYRGRPVYETVRSLASMASVKVICPVAKYPAPAWLHPRSYRYYPAPQSDFSLPGVEVRYFEYPVFPYLSRPLNGTLCRQKLMPLLKNEQPQLVLAYWLYPVGYAAVAAAEQLGVPAVVVGRGSDVCCVDGIVLRELTRRTLSQASYVITVSEELRRRAIQLGARPSQSKAVPNGCDLSVFYPTAKAHSRAHFGLPESAELILFVGRLVPSKGVRELLAAFEGLAAKRKSLYLVLAGEGNLESEIVAFLQRTGLRDRLRVVGPCPPVQIAQWINAADLVCLPSYSEGCPNTIIEALACGRPVVSTAVGGVAELVNSQNGILVDPGDAQALTRALDAALGRSWETEAIGNSSRRTWSDAAQETLSICEDVLSAFHIAEDRISFADDRAILATTPQSQAAPTSF
jgi:teichuronic acid biosynthesis glycosyltransferase TuaC